MTPDLFDPERVACMACGTWLYLRTHSSVPATVSMQVRCQCGQILEVAHDAEVPS